MVDEPQIRTQCLSKSQPLFTHINIGVYFNLLIPSGPDQNGVHINGGNSADIAWGIKEVLCDSDRAKKWGENGRKRVLQYFTWRKVAEQTVRIYEMRQHQQEQGECKVIDLMEKLTRT